MNARAGRIGYIGGRVKDAVGHFEKSTALVESDLDGPFILISCYTVLGDVENTRRIARMALERAEKALAQDRGNGYAMGVGVGALAALGESDRAKEWMDRGLLIDPDNLLLRYNFACTLAAWLNDPEAALAMLGPVLERDHGDNTATAKVDPDLAGLREDPRFQAMIAAAEARLAAG